RPQMQVFADGAARIAWPGEEGGAPPLVDLPDCPTVAENALLIRAMLNGERPIPRPLQEQAQALAALARG
ncbi:MAG TPA: DNA-binding protein YbiB, partial [Pseudothauera hydrothermalis]|nr:DNA-binding protein YbiB [Pseudothauera hydrothermalis]